MSCFASELVAGSISEDHTSTGKFKVSGHTSRYDIVLRLFIGWVGFSLLGGVPPGFEYEVVGFEVFWKAFLPYLVRGRRDE